VIILYTDRKEISPSYLEQKTSSCFILVFFSVGEEGNRNDCDDPKEIFIFALSFSRLCYPEKME
jgi:hypothetical protein